MNLDNLCSNSGILNAFLIIKVVSNIVCILLPILIMFRSFSAMFKVVLSGKDINKEILSVIKSVIAALIVFFLPTVFQFVFVDLLEKDSTPIVSCFSNASLENVKKLREEERELAKEKLKSENASKAEELNKQKEIEKQKNQEMREKYEAYKKDKEEEENRNNSSSSSSSGSSTTNLKPASVNIFVGDSRTVGMCIAITGDSAGCSYSSGGAKYYNDDIFIAQGSMSYSWFNSTAVSAVNSIIQANPNTTYNIYSLMGVNMLLYDIDKYVSSYNSLSSGSWSNHNIILVSVNPVDENKESQYGYSTKNNDILSFNSKLKSGVSGNNVKYCDTYTLLSSSLNTTDGLHYTSDTYRSLYGKIKSCGS